jgi:hypothetical protein
MLKEVGRERRAAAVDDWLDPAWSNAIIASSPGLGDVKAAGPMD